ncbi:MAG: insulinase family protein [Alistipes sp.]|nr:insulinase family protein [Alistipes sp.]
MKKFMLLLSGLLLATICGAKAPKYAPLPVDSAVRKGTLPNGLTYYIRHNDLPKQRADFYIAQRVGSILEEEQQRGLAHFLEHMAFNGTANFPGSSMLEYLQNRGIKFGTNVNAYTSFDQTVYNIMDVPTTAAGLLDSCLLVLHDWSGFISLEEPAIDKERKVIHEEWRTRSNATLRMYDSVMPKIFAKGNRYPYRMPIGTMEVVDNFPPQVLRDYYHKWYRPDLQGIVIVGDIDVDSMERQIQALWQDIPAKKRPAKRVYYPVEDNKELLGAVATDPEATSAMVIALYKFDKLTPAQKSTTQGLDNDYVHTACAMMLNDRLFELTQQANPPYLGAQFAEDDYFLAKTRGAYQLYASFRDDHWQPALDAAVGVLMQARSFGFTPAEYARAQARLESYFENQYKERNKVKNDTYVQRCLDNFLDDEPLLSTSYLYHYYQQRAPQITLDSVNGVFARMFTDPRNTAVVLMAPAKDSLQYPTDRQLVEAYRQASAVQVTPYVERVMEGGLVDQVPPAGAILSEEQGAFGTILWRLSNGASVLIKPTDFKSDEILFQAFSNGGTSAYPESDSLYMNFQNSVVTIGGLGRYNPTDLYKKLAGKKISYRPYVNATGEGVNASCTPKDLTEMMQLTYLLFTSPRRDTTLYNTWHTQMRTRLVNNEADPKTALQDTLMRTLYGSTPRYRRLTPARLDRLSYDRIMELYADRFADAGDFTFVFVGNVDTATLRPVVEQYLASLPDGQRREQSATLPFVRPGTRAVTFDKPVSTPKATAVLSISGELDYSLRNALSVSFLEQIMDIVYVETIREQEGGTYGVGVQASLLRQPYHHFMFTISFDTNNERVKALTDRALAELKQVAEQGPTEAAFGKVMEYMQKSYAQSIKENNYWLNQLVSRYRYGTDDQSLYLETLNQITPEDVARMARRVYDSSNRVEVVMNGVAKTE